MPINLLSFPNTSSLILICYVVFLYLYFKFFYVCIWTVVCNKGFIYIIETASSIPKCEDAQIAMRTLY